MYRKLVLSLLLVLGLVTAVQAAPAITVGDYPLHVLPNTNPTQTDTIDINYDAISGGGPMQGQTLYISVADEGNGGLSNADPGEPFIQNVDAVTGTVWAANNTGPTYSQVNDQLWSVDITTSTGTVNATGKVFSVTINRNGASNGSIWGLRVFVGVPDLAGPYSSNWSNGANIGVPFTTQDTATGWQGVTGVPDGSFQYIPEPSSVVLGLFAAAGFGAVVIRKRRARA
jgi:hypothetical protein